MKRISKTTSEAYLKALHDVLNDYEYTPSPRGQKTREILDYTFKVTNPSLEPIKTLDPKRNGVIERYSKDEFDIYDSCTNKVEDFVKISKFWGQLANPDNTVNSAYGYLIWKNKSHGAPWFENRDKLNALCQAEDDGILDVSEYFQERNRITSHSMRTPWEWAKESLIRDKDTRQAILRFSLPEHQWHGNKDQTCTLHGNFQIRNDELHLSITMRSNDLMRGLVYDLPWFVSLMYKMRNELLETYPNLKIGHYTHTSHSMHLYERDLKTIAKMLGYLEKEPTATSNETGNVAFAPLIYKKLIDGELPGFFIKDDENIYLIDSQDVKNRFVLGKKEYVVVKYK